MRRALALCTLIAACGQSDLPAPAGTGTDGTTDGELDPGSCDHLDESEPLVDGFVHLSDLTADSLNTGVGLEVVGLGLGSSLGVSCSGLSGMSVWDISDPEAPVPLASNVSPMYAPSAGIPRCTNIVLSPDERRVIISHRGDEVIPTGYLAMYDLEDPGNPVALDTWSTPVPLEGLALDGSTLLVGAHEEGVAAFDVSGDQLDAIGSLAPSATDAWEPAVIAPGLIAVAEGKHGLRTYAHDPTGITVLGRVPLEGSARDVEVHGDLAYVATSVGVSIVDVGLPAEPVRLGSVETRGTPNELSLVAPGVIVVAEWDRVRGYDVSDPASPVQVFSEGVPSIAPFARLLAIDADPETGRVLVGEWRAPHAYRFDGLPVGPDILVRPDALVYGQVDPLSPADQVLVIENHGNRPLVVDAITSNLPGVTADPVDLCVDAGAARAVEVRLETGDTEPVQGSVSILSNDVDDPSELVRLGANAAGIDVGDPAPEFTLQDLDGNTWTRSELEGQVVVLAYFATF